MRRTDARSVFHMGDFEVSAAPSANRGIIRGLMHALTVSPSFLPLADARRPRIGRAILGALVVAGIFEAFILGTKEFRPLGDHAPWMDDPYDVLTSFAMVFLPIVALLCAVRLALCRRSEPLPLSRVVGLVHGCVVLLVVGIATAASDWMAVIVGADRGSWSATTAAILAALGIVTAGLAVATVSLARESRRLPKPSGAGPAAPDWLDDVTALAIRMARRLGPLAPLATRIVRTVDGPISGWVRRRPVAAAVLMAVGFAALFEVGALREGYSLPLLVFVLGVAWCGMFAFLLAIGSYLGLVRSSARRIGASRRLLDATLLGCASVPIVLAFRDSLWGLVGTSASQAGLGDLDQLLIVGAASVFCVTFLLETVARINEPALTR